MSVKLIIERSAWVYRLHAKPAQTGEYFVTLTAKNGARLPNQPHAGFFPTLDHIVTNAEAIYSKLKTMHEANTPAEAAQLVHQ